MGEGSYSGRRKVNSEALAKIALFAGLNRKTIDSISEACSWRSVAKGTELFGAGVAATDVYFVVAGLVRVTTFSASGREVMFRELGAGSTLGTLAAIDGQSRSAAVVAVETTTFAVLPRDRFLALLTDHPALALAMLVDFAGLIRELTRRVVATTTATIPIRVCQELLSIARAGGIEKNKATLARLPTHAEFAARIGATREAVTREFSKLSAAGVISRAGKKIVITDIRWLEQAAEANEGY